jgi:cystathionine beta-lyase/cystathionine gamma-synthase
MPREADGGEPRTFAERYAADEGWSLETLSVHAGQEPDELTGAVAPPIYQTSTYAQDGIGRPRDGWEYARTGNPTRRRLERAVAALEGGEQGIAFSSGAAATAMLAELALPGDEVVIGDDVYGGTYRLFERVLRPKGINARYVDLASSPANVRSVLSPRTRLVWFETPTNPLLKLVDIAGVADAVAAHRGADG